LKAIYVRDANAPESAEPELIRARRGVILGSGGFEHNEQMRVNYQRAPITTEWTVGATANTGDGIITGEKLGAALDIIEDAWWGPTVPLVGAPWFALSERNSPGSIIVTMAGQRFRNESLPYVRRRNRRNERRTSNWPYWSPRSRHCFTTCAATAIRCTPIRNSLRQQGFHARSCTGCAPTTSPAKPSSTPPSTAT
jgi:hypothetical protein